MWPSSWMMRLDSSLKFREFSGFLSSSRIDFGYEPFTIFPLPSWILPIRSTTFKITPRALPSNSEVDTVDSLHAYSFLMRDVLRVCCRIALILFLLAFSLRALNFLAREDALSEVYCCCCFCQELLSTIFGAGRGVEGLSTKVRSPF